MIRMTVLAAGAVALAAGTVTAAPFTAGNLVVMRVANTNSSGSNEFFIDEFTRLGVPFGNTVAIDAGSSGATMTGAALIDDDRHLHRSTDGRFLTFGAYGALPGATNPASAAASTVNRVVGIVDQSGAVDLSTRLNDAYNNCAIRGVVSTDGNQLWIGGDNAGGTSISGGTRYATRGSSTTENLSRTQVAGGSPQPDNVRDIGIFGSQLWNCSGSGSSVGKGVHQVGIGLPTSGSQPLTAWTADTISTSSFYMVDTNSDTIFETMYAVAPNLVRKYVFDAGAWTAKGSLTLAGVLQVVATQEVNGSVTVFAGSLTSVISFNDANPITGSITGLSSSTIITAPSGYTLGGIEFSPVPVPGAGALLLSAGVMGLRRRR